MDYLKIFNPLEAGRFHFLINKGYTGMKTAGGNMIGGKLEGDEKSKFEEAREEGDRKKMEAIIQRAHNRRIAEKSASQSQKTGLTGLSNEKLPKSEIEKANADFIPMLKRTNWDTGESWYEKDSLYVRGNALQGFGNITRLGKDRGQGFRSGTAEVPSYSDTKQKLVSKTIAGEVKGEFMITGSGKNTRIVHIPSGGILDQPILSKSDARSVVDRYMDSLKQPSSKERKNFPLRVSESMYR